MNSHGDIVAANCWNRPKQGESCSSGCPPRSRYSTTGTPGPSAIGLERVAEPACQPPNQSPDHFVWVCPRPTPSKPVLGRRSRNPIKRPLDSRRNRNRGAIETATGSARTFGSAALRRPLSSAEECSTFRAMTRTAEWSRENDARLLDRGETEGPPSLVGETCSLGNRGRRGVVITMQVRDGLALLVHAAGRGRDEAASQALAPVFRLGPDGELRR